MNHIERAITIVKRLVNAGYIAYFAGGYVRDLIMKHPSEDIDIATNAPPEAVMELFKKTIPVGIAFGVVIVVIEGDQFEVATFRKDFDYVGGRRPAKIEFSTAQEDASRRDFTINGMFYDPIRDQILDYVNGEEDIKKGVIRTIGNPHERFLEDRLRMVRAVRFASRFDFKIDVETQQAIQQHAINLFPAVAMERIWQELVKMARFPSFGEAIIQLHQLGLLPVIFPRLQSVDLELIQSRVASFNQFPQGTPTILYLLELFPTASLEELLELCQYLKVSGYEGKITEYTYKGKELLHQEKIAPHSIESSDWVKFYADQLFQQCFGVMTARYPEESRIPLLESHSQRRVLLLPHIQRMVEKTPLVTAAMLLDHGISPGKEMGQLLKEAEKIAIAKDLHDPEAVIQLLKESPLWQKK